MAARGWGGPPAPRPRVIASVRVARRILLGSALSALSAALLVLAIGIWVRGSPLYLGPNGGFIVAFPIYPAAAALAIAAFVVLADAVAWRGTSRLLGALGASFAAGFIAAVLPVGIAQAALELSSVYWYGRYAMFLPGSFLAGGHVLFLVLAAGWADRGRASTALAVTGLIASMEACLTAFALFSYRVPGIGVLALGLATVMIAADAGLLLTAVRSLRARAGRA